MKKKILAVLAVLGISFGQLQAKPMSKTRLGLTLTAESALLSSCAYFLLSKKAQKFIQTKLRIGKVGMRALKIAAGTTAFLSAG
ncbi:hypothetical protein ACFLY6_01615, partial [Candidatus Dependentiae bacterium]